jgi:O-methyltransferase
MRNIVRQARRAAKLVVGEPPERKKARHDIAAAFVSRLGFRMYGPEASWFESDDFSAAWTDFPCRDGLINDRRFNLYNLAKALASVQGDLAECGVNVGRGSYLMLAANPNNTKHLYGFDSFEGLSETTQDDRPRDARAKPWQARDLAVDEAMARSNLRAFDGRFTLLKGWIPERFDEVADKRFSFVHVDVDLYEPTRDSIAFFWPRLNAGGLLVCDDYGSRRCPGARKAMDEFARAEGLQVAELSSMQGLLFKPLSRAAE